MSMSFFFIAQRDGFSSQFSPISWEQVLKVLHLPGNNSIYFQVLSNQLTPFGVIPRIILLNLDFIPRYTSTNLFKAFHCFPCAPVKHEKCIKFLCFFFLIHKPEEKRFFRYDP